MPALIPVHVRWVTVDNPHSTHTHTQTLQQPVWLMERFNFSFSITLSSTNTTFLLVTSLGIHPTPPSPHRFTCSHPVTHHNTGRSTCQTPRSIAPFYLCFHVTHTPPPRLCLVCDPPWSRSPPSVVLRPSFEAASPLYSHPPDPARTGTPVRGSFSLVHRDKVMTAVWPFSNPGVGFRPPRQTQIVAPKEGSPDVDLVPIIIFITRCVFIHSSTPTPMSVSALHDVPKYILSTLLGLLTFKDGGIAAKVPCKVKWTSTYSGIVVFLLQIFPTY